jgi:hypothetical protein
MNYLHVSTHDQFYHYSCCNMQSSSHIPSISLWRWYINTTILCFWTLLVVLYLFKTHNVSETGFCSRLQVETILLSQIDRASSYLWRTHIGNGVFIRVSVRPYVSFAIPLDEFRFNLTLGLRTLCSWGNSTSVYLVTPKASTLYKI